MQAKLIFGFTAALVISPVGLAGQRSQMASHSLLAVPAVFVEVEGIDSVAAADGLDPESIRSNIETLVAAANIPLLSQADWQQLIGNPALVLRFELIKVSRFVYIYRMALELRQLTVLVRDTTKLVFVPTWAAGSRLGSIQAGNLHELGDRVPEMVDWFVGDYWSVRDSRDSPPVQRSGIGMGESGRPESARAVAPSPHHGLRDANVRYRLASTRVSGLGGS